jgi:hypothetical protein
MVHNDLGLLAEGAAMRRRPLTVTLMLVWMVLMLSGGSSVLRAQGVDAATRARVDALRTAASGMPAAKSSREIPVTEADTATRARLDTLLTTAPGTPAGKSLVGVAVAEARVALAQAVLAEEAPKDLAAMQQYAAGVLHALDPTLTATGPGAGYGVRRALAEIVTQVETTASADRKADATRLTARAMTAARGAQLDTEALVRVAQQLRKSSSLAEAVPLTTQARALAQRLLAGEHDTFEGGMPRPSTSGLFALQSSLTVLAVSRTGQVPSPVSATREAER